MAIIRTTVLGGDDAPLAVTVDHDPTLFDTDVPAGSLIIVAAGALPPAGKLNNWYRKLTTGSDKNVQLVSNMDMQGVTGAAATAGENVKFVGGTGGAGAGGNGGTALFDAGAAGGGVAGVASLGTANAEAVLIGRTAKLSSMLGELNYPQTMMTLVNGSNIDINITAAAGNNLGKVYYLITGPGSAFTTGGFADTTDGRVICVQNQSGLTWTIKNEDPAELTVTRRILTESDMDFILPGPSVVWFIYDKTAQRWILWSVRSFAGMGTGGGILQWAATGVAASGVRFLQCWAGTGPADAAEGLRNDILVPGNPSRVLRNARVSIKTAPGVGKSVVFNVYDNGVPTVPPIVVTISGASLVGSNTTDSAVVLAGRKLTVVGERLGGPPVALNPDDTLFSIEAM